MDLVTQISHTTGVKDTSITTALTETELGSILDEALEGLDLGKEEQTVSTSPVSSIPVPEQNSRDAQVEMTFQMMIEEYRKSPAKMRKMISMAISMAIGTMFSSQSASSEIGMNLNSTIALPLEELTKNPSDRGVFVECTDQNRFLEGIMQLGGQPDASKIRKVVQQLMPEGVFKIITSERAEEINSNTMQIFELSPIDEEGRKMLQLSLETLEVPEGYHEALLGKNDLMIEMSLIIFHVCSVDSRFIRPCLNAKKVELLAILGGEALMTSNSDDVALVKKECSVELFKDFQRVAVAYLLDHYELVDWK